MALGAGGGTSKIGQFDGGSGHGMTKNGDELVNNLVDWTGRRWVLFLVCVRRLME